MALDPVDALVTGWATELPELETAAMATLARINRAALLVGRRVDSFFAEQGVSTGEFDVLSVLRRQGAPYRLKPSELARATMLSPSGMTNRLDRLEAAGLIERTRDPDNRRIAPVALTATGLATVDELVGTYVARQEQMLAGLPQAQRRQLDTLLGRLIQAVD